jgi:hypothetical protein
VVALARHHPDAAGRRSAHRQAGRRLPLDRGRAPERVRGLDRVRPVRADRRSAMDTRPHDSLRRR